MMEIMNGAESLVRTLIASGVDTCFANPGTSEMHFVAALDRIAGIRCVLCLQENVATGAADGYFRMVRRPAATLLHCGPGLMNGLANLHNARRAGSGVVAIVGDQATYHRPLDAPLTADTEGLARTVSAWVRTAAFAAAVGADAAQAVQAARAANGQVATLILPADTAWSPGGRVAQALPVPPPVAVPDGHAIDGAVRLLQRGSAMLLLGGAALTEAGLRHADAIVRATGGAMLAQTTSGRLPRGRGRVPVERLPYPVDAAIAALASAGSVILVGAPPPVGFFAYPGKPSRLQPPGAELLVLARPDQDCVSALALLADALDARPAPLSNASPPIAARGRPTPEALAVTIAASLSEGSVVADEALTMGRATFPGTHGAAPHEWLALCGGAIGEGLPLATGAAIGAPGRRVVSLQADGSAMYTLQALWTQARERLPVTTVLLNNRKYAILMGELRGTGAAENPGPTALGMLDLGNPDLDWVRLAQGCGVEAASTETCEGLAALLMQANGVDGPFLIDLRL